ncbi:MAG: hypothetical protein WC477_06925 [Patescibacteria group bacterium]
MIKIKLLGLVNREELISAVKDIRTLLKTSLKEAKEIAESLRDGVTPTVLVDESVLAEYSVANVRYVILIPDVSADRSVVRDSLAKAVSDLMEMRRFDLVKDIASVLERL